MGHRPLVFLALLLALLAALAPRAGLASPADEALALVGSRYTYGGDSPDEGFDCSGLVTHVFRRAWHMELPHSARALSRLGAKVSLRELTRGDLVFYNTRRRPYSHVGIYLGGGRFVHAPRRGKRVRVESVHAAYWLARFNGARRLAPPEGSRRFAARR